ncbi:MAG: ATP-binding cassette domain-containing protein, partial [Oscillospiraceae bacterium]
MLTLTNIKKTFNSGTVNERLALNNLNLTLSDGDFVTVIGGNGAGKSTLLNLIAGVFPPDDGESSILLDSINMTNMPEFKRAAYLGRVFQDPMLGTASDMGIDENLSIAMRRGKRRTLKWQITPSETAFFEKSLKALDLGLENCLTQKVGLLSGGQRQALSLLMSTLQKPRLLLLDEHTAALAPKTAKKVLELTQSMVHSNNITTLMVTHNMLDAIKLGNR